jgi:hypothetical protein
VPDLARREPTVADPSKSALVQRVLLPVGGGNLALNPTGSLLVSVPGA